MVISGSRVFVVLDDQHEEVEVVDKQLFEAFIYIKAIALNAILQ